MANAWFQVIMSTNSLLPSLEKIRGGQLHNLPWWQYVDLLDLWTPISRFGQPVLLEWEGYTLWILMLVTSFLHWKLWHPLLPDLEGEEKRSPRYLANSQAPLLADVVLEQQTTKDCDSWPTPKGLDQMPGIWSALVFTATPPGGGLLTWMMRLFVRQ